jgi:hypothetical protein
VPVVCWENFTSGPWQLEDALLQKYFGCWMEKELCKVRGMRNHKQRMCQNLFLELYIWDKVLERHHLKFCKDLDHI